MLKHAYALRILKHAYAYALRMLKHMHEHANASSYSYYYDLVIL
jgi:hypothetical protein